MTKLKTTPALLFPIFPALLVALAMACTEDELAGPGPLPDAAAEVDATSDAGMNICFTVGNGDPTAGAAGIDGVVDQFLSKVTTDCKINQYFAGLNAKGVAHLSECLKIQVKELLGCPGFTYAGSKDKDGVVCRDMVLAHQGLAITEPDYDALIADLVSVIPEGVKTHPDFAGVAGALTAPKDQAGSLKAQIIENKASTSNPKASCTDAGADTGPT